MVITQLMQLTEKLQCTVYSANWHKQYMNQIGSAQTEKAINKMLNKSDIIQRLRLCEKYFLARYKEEKNLDYIDKAIDMSKAIEFLEKVNE